MAEEEKEKKSVLGLGLPGNAGDPSAWRPTKAVRRAEAGLSLTDALAGKPKADEPRADAAGEDPASETTSRMAENSAANRERAGEAAAWRPSKVNEERLSSLSPVRGRKRFAMSPRTRLAFTAALFACGAYFFVKVWLMPEAGGLHAALVIAAVIILLLFASAIVGTVARRRRKRGGDDESILRL